jgi:uncharacterized membrane protein
MSSEQAKHNSDEPHRQIEKLESEVENIKKLIVNKEEKLEKKVFTLEGAVNSIAALINVTENLQIPLIHLVGYYLVISSFLNYLSLFIPLKLLDAAWELNTIASLVNNTPAMLIGLMLVFTGRSNTTKIERRILSLLSTATLLAAIFFVLLLPVGFHDTIRIYRINNAQNFEARANQAQQIESLETALNKTTSVQEVENLMKFSAANDSPQESTLESAKSKAKERIKIYQEKTYAEIEKTKQEQWLGLVRDSVRYIIGLVLCAAFYISIWRITKDIVVSLGNYSYNQ